MQDPILTLFVREGCPWCSRARTMLDSHMLDYVVHKRDSDLFATEYAPLVPKTHTTVPMIFMGHLFIGGHDDLANLIA